MHAACRTPHGSSETIRQQIEQLNCMQHQRFSALLSQRPLCSCTSLCLPCGAPKSVSVLLNSHPLAWLKVARKMHVFHWTRSVMFSIGNCVQASVRELSGLAVFWIFVGLPFTHLYPSRSLASRIWNLAVAMHSSERFDTLSIGPLVIENLFRNIVLTRLSLSHHLDVFHWARESFIV